MKRFTACSNDEGMRLSRFVLRVTQNLPNSLLYKSFRNKRIKRNGKKAAPDDRLRAGDIIELYLKDEFFYSSEETAQASCKTPIISTPLPPIVYEDENIVLFNKPCGLLCHSDHTGDADLAGLFYAYLLQKNEFDASGSNGFSPALCNRLDRGTSGLVIGAKNYPALRDMNAIIRMGLVVKQYICVVKGQPKDGLYTAYWRRRPNSKKAEIRPQAQTGFVPIKTGVAVLEACGALSLVNVTLYTGKTHQIRAHLSFLGFPLLGDRKYGEPALNTGFACKHQLLCAYRLAFGDIPADNSLSYLKGKDFILSDPCPIAFFRNIKKGYCSSKSNPDRKPAL